MRRSLRQAPSLAIALAAGVGCASTPPRPAPDHVLLSPVSFNQSLPESLEAGVQIVRDEIAAQLAARGVEVSTPPLAEFHDVWLQAGRDIGTLYDSEGRFDDDRFDAAAKALVESYRSRGVPFDTVLLAYLDVRVATVRGGRASWDGVKRLVPMDLGGGRKERVRWPNLLPMTCASLRILAYAQDGERLFDRRGGLDVAVEYVAGLRARPRQDLFVDADAVREGVGIALAPLFPE